MAKRWGRIDDEGYVVEFTFENPEGRFHPDLVWVEVNADTKYGTKLTLFGTEEVRDSESIVGITDEQVLWEQSQERIKKEEEEANNPLPPSEYTIQVIQS